ncbi:zinc-dependent alcohol dehydrogenase [Alicyclobacillus fodiniaquatilis]|uniref:Zinc-binding dehydrogenase n=1 Tax=Alicyclobacillus fodiniaquatilis TaxID=1661150 RepID=A0ABW4JLD1_9BACL
MKCLVWQGPRRIAVEEYPKPVLKSGEVLIKVSLVGICGSELSGYLGENSLRKPPLVMGHEFSGTIEEIADNVTGLENGMLVTVNPLFSCNYCSYCRSGFQNLCPKRSILGIHRPGAFAEYVAVPATACYRVKGEIEGALTEPLACSVRAATQARIELGETVVVFGAGIIGLMSVLSAKEKGAFQIVVVDTNDTRLKKALEWGATNVFNPSHGRILDEIRQLAPLGVDKVIDAVGLPITRQNGLEVVRSGGRVVWIGLHEDEIFMQGNHLVRQEIEVVGSFCYTDRDFQVALAMLDKNLHVSTDTWLDVRPLELGQNSFEEQIDGPAKFPKIMLRVNG